MLHQLMRRAGVDTLVTLYQAPGKLLRTTDSTLAWKPEVFRQRALSEERFFDATRRPCAIRFHPIHIPWTLANGSVWRTQTYDCAWCEGAPLIQRACLKEYKTKT